MAVRITHFAHGTTTDNEADRATGWLPGTLSELGIRQARELGSQVADRTFDRFFCSDLQRSIDSFNLGFIDQYPMHVEKRLRECNYGDLNGAPDEFKQDFDRYVDTPYPNGESYRGVEQRIRSFLGDLARDYAGQSVAIIGHEAPQLALEVILNGKTWHEAYATDWRRTKSWQPGWEYVIPDGWESNVETTTVAGKTYEIRALRPVADTLPTEQVDVNRLKDAVGEGHTYWLDRDGHDLGPCQLLADWEAATRNPAWADHVATIDRADLTQPLWIYEDGTVFDGIHRLTRAVRDGVQTLPVKRFTASDLPEVA